jgi:RNA polymerase sigma-B factor
MDPSALPAPDRSRKPVLPHLRNASWLREYAASRDQRRRRRWRDALVRANLPLVRQLAGRLAPRTGLPFDDLVQVGALGLLRAIEAFDPRRGARFSSFAVPFIRGAIAHELRDRGSLVRIPRPLWDLRQRASSLQERLRGQNGQTPAGEELARQLGCRPEQLAEALALGRLRELPSLDAPLPGAEGEGSPRCLLDLLTAPPPLEAGPDGTLETAELAGQRQWLADQLAALQPPLRRLLIGRQLEGASWVELGRELNIHPRMAQRRHDASLAELQEAARIWRQGQTDRQQGGDQGLQTIHQLVAEPAPTPLQGGADQAFQQGGQQGHRAHQRPGTAIRQQTQGPAASSHHGAAGQAGGGSLQADRPLGPPRDRPQAGDQHGGAPPALADLTAESVRQLGGEAGRKAHQQQGRPRGGQQGPQQRQGGAGGG